MNTRAITNFDHVILYELQQQLKEGKQRPEMKFGEIVRVCTKAGRNFIIPKTTEVNRSAFYADMFKQIEMLAASEWITIHNDHAGKLASITLTDRGADYLNDTIFTNQKILQER